MVQLPSTNVTNKGRAFVVLYVLCWTVIIVLSWVYWTDMNLILKSLIVLAEILFVPDIESIRRTFRQQSK